MSKEKIKSLQLEIEKERQHIDSLTNNLQEKNEQLISKEKELEELMSAQPWKPSKGDTYYFANARGIISKYDWIGDYSDECRVSYGNCFKNQEAAIKRRDFMQFLTDNNLWDKVEQRVRLQVELEPMIKEVGYPNDYFTLGEDITFFFENELLRNYDHYSKVETICNKFGESIKTLFEPLT